MTCLSNQHKGFMVRSYNERLHWEYETSEINLASAGHDTWNSPHPQNSFKLHHSQLNNWTWDRRKLYTNIGQTYSFFKIKYFIFKHAYPQIELNEAWNMEKRKTNELLSHFSKILSSTFSAIRSTSKPFALTFNFTVGKGGGGGRYTTLNSIFHSWANHVLFQQ